MGYFLKLEVDDGRRRSGREFKFEAVRLIKERGVSVAQASQDLDVHENALRKWARDLTADPVQALPGCGQMKPEPIKIEQLRRKLAKLEAEHDVLNRGGPENSPVDCFPPKAALCFAGEVTCPEGPREAWNSRSRRGIVPSGRWRGCAKCWMCHGPASMPGSTGRPASVCEVMRRLRPGCRRASPARRALMAQGVSGVMCWRKAPTAAVTASSG